MTAAPTITVITATTGDPLLAGCLAGVQAQSYPHIRHLVVIDGPEHAEKARALLDATEGPHPVEVIQLPRPTGRDRFNGHRVYGAAPYLCDGEFVAFLDEDNWFEPDHLASLVEAAAEADSVWAYALRSIVDRDGTFLMRDDCESLGRWPTWRDASDHLVDVSCYLLQRKMAISLSPIWYRKTRELGVREVDRELCQQLLRHAPRFAATGRYTVNYRLGSTPTTVAKAFFEQGNQVMLRRYPDGFPWRKDESVTRAR